MYLGVCVLDMQQFHHLNPILLRQNPDQILKGYIDGHGPFLVIPPFCAQIIGFNTCQPNIK
jgi:hypothetical protein